MCMQVMESQALFMQKKTDKIPTLSLIYISWIASDKKVSFLMITLKGEGSKRVCQFVISLVTRIAVLVITFPLFPKIIEMICR